MIDWIDNIPSHWDVSRVGWSANVLTGDTFDSNNFNTKGKGEKLARIRDVPRGDSSTYYTGDYDEKYRIDDGDILVGMDGDFHIGIWEGGPTLLNQRVACIRGSNVIQNKYLRYLLATPIQMIHDLTRSTTVKHLSVNDLRDIQIPIPPDSEMENIVSFIDSNKSTIDELELKYSNLISFLHDRRDRLTWNLVTSGSNSHNNFKKSDLDGLDEIPVSWDMVKLGWVTKHIGSGYTPEGGSSVYVDDGIPFIRSQNVTDQGLDLSNVAFIEESTHQEMAATQVQSNDVLLNITGASLGRCARVPSDVPPANVNQHVSIIRPDPESLYPAFLKQMISSHVIQNQIFANQSGASREAVTFSQIADFWIPLPPIEEQRGIAGQIQDETTRIWKIIDYCEEMINLLTEKRQALISAAVTGQFDMSEEKGVIQGED